MTMTTVNWERESGESIEEFVAALILLANPQGNRITPSRGDRGIDVQVESSGQWDIYQIKKFTRPLTASQRNQIRDSWDTFVAQTLPGRSVRSWTLVMPWDPTLEQLAWLDELTAGHDFDVRWWGLSQLDGLASGCPALAAYYFGDGGQRITELMEQMLALAGDIPGERQGDGLLDRIIDRQRQIVQALTRLDPFYKYVVDIRTGNAQDLEEGQAQRDAGGAALVQYLQISDDQYAVTRLLPLSAESSWMRPIGGTLAFSPTPDSEQQAALSDFLDYGTPFTEMPGELTEVTGPPGLMTPGGGLFTVSPMNSEGSLPPLELQLSSPSFGVTQRLEVTNVRSSRGPRGDGFSVSANDRSATLGFVLKMRTNNGKVEQTFDFKVLSSAGKYPGDVVPAVTFISQFDGRNEVNLGVRGGVPLAYAMRPDGGTTSKQARAFLSFLEDLILIQNHTYSPVRVPDLAACTQAEHDSVGVAARLLRGEKIEGLWDSFQSDVLDAHHPMFSQPGSVTILTQEPLHVTLDGVRTDLNKWMQLSFSGAVAKALPVEREGVMMVPVSNGTVVAQMIEAPAEGQG
jgi:hypothetical protein